MISESILFLQDILKMHISCLQVADFEDFLLDIEMHITSYLQVPNLILKMFIFH